METIPELRTKLAALDDPQIEALALDCFPEVKDKFSEGMRRDSKVNLLLDHCRRNPGAIPVLEGWLSRRATLGFSASKSITDSSRVVINNINGIVANTISAPIAMGERSIAASGNVTIVQDGGHFTHYGGIRAREIRAENVVDGVQLQSGTPETAMALVELARKVRSGGITADMIQAGNVVSGIQFIWGKVPVTLDELRQEVSALRVEVQRAIVAQEITKAGDVADVQDSLEQAEQELNESQPDGERVTRKLASAADILTKVAGALQSVGKVGAEVIKLAPIAAMLWKLAESLW